MFFGGVIISEQLVVTAYGAKYREAAVLLVGLLLYQLVRTQSRVLTQTLSGMDMPGLIMRISVVTLVTNVVLGYGLLITVGLIGVVIGTVVAESVRYLCNAMFVHRYEPNVTIIPRQIRLQVLSSGLMCAVVFLLERVVKINSFVILGTIVGAGACVYGVSLFVLSDHFRDTCTRILSNFVG
jgi:O-antigen/teichoic acid export membrane protein